MEDFVSYKIAVKLKEKGFTIPTKSIFGMYNEIGVFHTLTTSADYSTCDSGFKYRCYYNYNDFDERDFIAPTISQVLKWLRNNKKTMVSILPVAFNEKENKFNKYYCTIYYATKEFVFESHERPDTFNTYEECALDAIEYVLDNLI